MVSVIFDLDGTLIDSAPDIHAAVNRCFAAHGWPPFTLAQVHGFVGRGAPNLIARALESRGLPHDGPLFQSVLTEFLQDYETAHGMTQVYPGVIAALDALQARGARLGLCTNKPLAPTRSVLARTGLARFFPVVIGGDSLAVRKPDPAPLLKAQIMLGGGPALFVGDSEVDAETARHARLPFLLYTEGYRKSPVDTLAPIAAFDDYAQLPGLIRQLDDATAP